MKLLITLLLIFEVSFSLNLNFYRKTVLDGTDWQVFVNKTVPFSTKTKIECGSYCSLEEFGGCDLFIQKQSAYQCYIGYFENLQTTHLTGQSGPQNVYLHPGKMEEAFKASYLTISYIDDQTEWSKYIYDFVEMESHHDKFDCSFTCKNVHKEEGCNLFVVHESICYVGKSSHTSGGVYEIPNMNETVYITEGDY